MTGSGIRRKAWTLPRPLRPVYSIISWLVLALLLPLASPAALQCDLSGYQPQSGLTAFIQDDQLIVRWVGEQGISLRLNFAIDNGRPVIRELAWSRGGPWQALGRNLLPEYSVVAGKRRISNQQLAPLRRLGVPITEELIEREKWNAFWDAPLVIPGLPGTNPDLPRSADEIRRGESKFHTTSCRVRTNGQRLEVYFPGLELGIFEGGLQFTVYRGLNLIRMEAIARTQEPSVAYKYDAGLSGFSVDGNTRVVWRDVSRAWQEYRFGGSPNEGRVPVRARHRVLMLEPRTVRLPPSRLLTSSSGHGKWS